jgi:coproporphyrinogen III oxidase
MLAYTERLQERLCGALEALEGDRRFDRRRLSLPHGGSTRRHVSSDGAVIERAAVLVTHTRAPALPPTTTSRRPGLAGHPYEAASISVVVHPRNPYAPTGHLNLRYFEAAGDDAPAWFGGGFDLTPVYGFVEDAVGWHRAAREACAPFGDGLYPRCKRRCDEYFVLRHRGGEARGIGGILFDDLDDLEALGGRDGVAGAPDAAHARELDRCLAFAQRVGDAFAACYLAILERRRDTPWGERQRAFQLWRRGRYVEFNLLWDRGTRFGLEAGHSPESLLASLPPLAAWRHDAEPEPGTEEAAALDLLVPREWAELDGGDAPKPAGETPKPAGETPKPAGEAPKPAGAVAQPPRSGGAG